MNWYEKYQNKIKSLKKEEIEKVVVDEIFTFIKNKNIKGFEKSKKKNWTYLFTAIIKTKSGKTFPFFDFCQSRNEENLINFLKALKNCQILTNFIQMKLKFIENLGLENLL